MKQSLLNILRKFSPSMVSEYTGWRKGFEEPEMALLSYLCDKNNESIDIGAAGGSYTFLLLKHSLKVHAFEPRKTAFFNLQKRFSYSKKLYLYNSAISEITGNFELKIPISDLGKSTLEMDNSLNNLEYKTEMTKTHKLDDFSFDNIDLIKIDVEGHEGSVLKGAIKTIEKNKPSIIIEMEERHKVNTIKTNSDFFLDRGYRGFFLINGKLKSIKEFNVKHNQDVENITDSNSYTNNFLFIHDTRFELYSKLMEYYG